MREAQHYRPRLAWLLVLLLAGVGCRGKYQPVSVSGVVTLDKAPVEGATVYFYATGDAREGRPAQGITDKNGKFHLSTLRDRDGALPGQYKVVIHKYVPTNPNLKVPDFPDTPEGKAARDDFNYRNFEAKGIQPFTNSLPDRYGNSESTPFTCTVKRSMTVSYEMTSK